jgi:hypothetical protein
MSSAVLQMPDKVCLCAALVGTVCHWMMSPVVVFLKPLCQLGQVLLKLLCFFVVCSCAHGCADQVPLLRQMCCCEADR